MPTPQSTNSNLSTNMDEYLAGNEKGDAELFKALFTDRYIYDHINEAWFRFTGHFWEQDMHGESWLAIADGVASEYLAEAARQRNNGNQGKESELIRRAAALRSRKRVTAVLDWAKALMPLPTAWDSEPMQLPVANGVIDLQTGNFRYGTPGEYLKLHSPTAWQRLDFPAPHWESFLQDVFNFNQEIINFFQRLLGYTISGRANEKVLPILYGEHGNNGKTTLLETIKTVLGSDFTKKDNANVLMETKFSGGERPSDFIVSLPGKRLFWANESREGARFDVGLLKELAGGDTMSGRGVYAKHGISFRPSHVIYLVTNRLPHLTADDNAAWNRILPIGFVTSFVENPIGPDERKINKQLPELLASEASGILAWLVRGCLEWQKVGLNPPNAVVRFRAYYRESEDDFGAFCAECLDFSEPQALMGAKDLYSCYRAWALDYGLNPMNGTAFGRRISVKISKTTTRTGVVYQGVRRR